ncbi:hypothetical protein RJ640_008060 [Escallonia rubra]|uniref:Cytochrome P450 n=1 Tax=Escallonia rubra TaxID=112253 RepID=A0AA88RJD8_9ASTE|nr:hypothetical protein RJ640_008060 [Escallonia rubra]
MGICVIIYSLNVFCSRILKNGDDVESDKLEKGIGDLMVGIIQKREKLTTGEGNSYGSDFLGLLLNARKDAPGNYKLSLKDIIDECKTFYGAGQGTTSILLSWTVLLLAIHTDWQDKAREEVLRIFGQQNPTSEGIARLRTMNMIFSETLRLYPPADVLTRKVQRKVRLGKLILPANMNVNIPLLALHHDPKIWGKDAHLFNPERFSEGVPKATSNNPAAYIPFGLGPRNCVGMNFATNEAKIALTMILQHYKFTLSPNYIHSPIHMVLVRPQHGVRLFKSSDDIEAKKIEQEIYDTLMAIIKKNEGDDKRSRQLWKRFPWITNKSKPRC